MKPSISKILLLIAFCLVSSFASFAQSVGVRIMPADNAPSQFKVTIVVENGSAQMTADNAPVIDKCTLVDGPEVNTTRNMEIKGGQQVRVTTREYTYIYSTEHPGRIVVPSITIQVNGQPVETPTKTFTLAPNGSIE